MKKVTEFIKNEAVMLISLLLALVSAFFVKPSAEYLDYIDLRTLSLLFCLMAVMAGFNKLGLFKALAQKLLGKVKTVSGVVLTLVLLCFFSSMIITNDVALITFVPFTIIVFRLADKTEKLIFAVTLETVAANLGSMVTPIGNPQNLYLFSSFDMKIGDFMRTISPYAALSLVLLVAASMFFGRSPLEYKQTDKKEKPDVIRTVFYFVLFALALLGVFNVIKYYILLAVVIAAVLIVDRKNILNVDYSLLLTFVFLFVFIGNLGKIPEISGWLAKTVNGNEVPVGIAASQVFSNVPAAILLSDFTGNAPALLVGVNLGGLGTLIASMASLISFKFIQKENTGTAKYFGVFTAMNVLFLGANIALWLVLR